MNRQSREGFFERRRLERAVPARFRRQPRRDQQHDDPAKNFKHYLYGYPRED